MYNNALGSTPFSWPLGSAPTNSAGSQTSSYNGPSSTIGSSNPFQLNLPGTTGSNNSYSSGADSNNNASVWAQAASAMYSDWSQGLNVNFNNWMSAMNQDPSLQRANSIQGVSGAGETASISSVGGLGDRQITLQGGIQANELQLQNQQNDGTQVNKPGEAQNDAPNAQDPNQAQGAGQTEQANRAEKAKSDTEKKLQEFMKEAQKKIQMASIEEDPLRKLTLATEAMMALVNARALAAGAANKVQQSDGANQQGDAVQQNPDKQGEAQANQSTTSTEGQSAGPAGANGSIGAASPAAMASNMLNLMNSMQSQAGGNSAENQIQQMIDQMMEQARGLKTQATVEMMQSSAYTFYKGTEMSQAS